MNEIRHRTVRANGIDLRIAESGDGQVVLLLHGFPESSYSWRHQLPALAAAGFHAVAPDLRAATLCENLADLTGLLDALDAPVAALVGHDQGAGIAWAAAQLDPERFTALVALGVPYAPRPPKPLPQLLRERNPDRFNVVTYFQQQGVAEAELDADVAATLRMTLFALSGQAPQELVRAWLLDSPADSGFLDPLPDPGMPSRWSPWLTDAEFDVYVREFERTGFAGAIRRYRAFEQDWFDLPEVGTTEVTQPTLYIAGELDSAYRFGSLDPMRAMVPGLREVVLLPGCGHWTQQERPAEVNEHLITFLLAEFDRR